MFDFLGIWFRVILISMKNDLKRFAFCGLLEGDDGGEGFFWEKLFFLVRDSLILGEVDFGLEEKLLEEVL